MQQPFFTVSLFFIILFSVCASHPSNLRHRPDCTENCLQRGGTFGDICVNCAPGYFLTSQGACESCDQQCQLCQGPLETECLSCKSELSNLIDGRCQLIARNLQTANITLPNNSFSPFENYLVYYEWTNDSNQTASIDFYFVYSGKHWFGLGFGTQMEGADIMTVEFVNGQAVVNDRIGLGEFLPPLDTSQGGTSDDFLVEYSSNDTMNVIHVTRKQSTGDVDDFQLTGPGSYNMISACSPTPDVEYHDGNRTALTVTLAANQ